MESWKGACVGKTNGVPRRQALKRRGRILDCQVRAGVAGIGEPDGHEAGRDGAEGVLLEILTHLLKIR
jgi:hypothetical protein